MYFHVVFHWLINLETTIRLSFTVCLKPSNNPENDLERDREKFRLNLKTISFTA